MARIYIEEAAKLVVVALALGTAFLWLEIAKGAI